MTYKVPGTHSTGDGKFSSDRLGHSNIPRGSTVTGRFRDSPAGIADLPRRAGYITAARYHDFSAGHRVFGHENKCGYLHGHNYRVTFTVQGKTLDPVGRVMDFSAIKECLCQWLEDNWDHKMLLLAVDDYVVEGGRLEGDPSVVLLTFNPTAENMAFYLLHYVGPKQLRGTGIELIHVNVEETRKCSANAGL